MSGDEANTEKDGPIALDGMEHVRELSLRIASNARRTLDIVGRDLEPRLYDNKDFADAVRKLAVSSRYARIRLVALDAGMLPARGHRLILLAQQLSSFISIRIPNREYSEFNEAMLIADERAWIHRRPSDRFEGFASFDNPGEGRALSRSFDDLWEHSAPDPNFKRLSL